MPITPTTHIGRDSADDFESDLPSCPMCSGPGMSMGALGNREHFRCQSCGMDFSFSRPASAPAPQRESKVRISGSHVFAIADARSLPLLRDQDGVAVEVDRQEANLLEAEEPGAVFVEMGYEPPTPDQIQTNDEQVLFGATTAAGSALPVWDDGFGPLWVVTNEHGVIGLVRAETFDKAYSAAVDEIAPDYDDPTMTAEDFEALQADGSIQYRGSGTPSNSASNRKSAIADTEHLEVHALTQNQVEQFGIAFDLRTREEEPPSATEPAPPASNEKRAQSSATQLTLEQKLVRHVNGIREELSGKDFIEKSSDPIAAQELYLYIKGHGDLYRKQYVPILRNLTIKKARGVYDQEKGVRWFQYLADNGAKHYFREFGSPSDDRTLPGASWHQMFPVDVRIAVARELEDDFEVEHGLGNYSEMLPKKYRPKAAKKNNDLTKPLPKTEKRADGFSSKEEGFRAQFFPGWGFGRSKRQDDTKPDDNKRCVFCQLPWSPEAAADFAAFGDPPRTNHLRVLGSKWAIVGGSTYCPQCTQNRQYARSYHPISGEPMREQHEFDRQSTAGGSAANLGAAPGAYDCGRCGSDQHNPENCDSPNLGPACPECGASKVGADFSQSCEICGRGATQTESAPLVKKDPKTEQRKSALVASLLRGRSQG